VGIAGDVAIVGDRAVDEEPSSPMPLGIGVMRNSEWIAPGAARMALDDEKNLMWPGWTNETQPPTPPPTSMRLRV